MNQRRELIETQHVLSTRKQCDILSIHRSGLYYKPKGEKEENLGIMQKMDMHYLDHPTAGVLRMQDHLRCQGYTVNHKRVRRLLRLMGLIAIYPKKNLSKLGHKKYIHPYLLKGLKINRPNQVWAIDISAPGNDLLSNERSPPFLNRQLKYCPTMQGKYSGRGLCSFILC